MRKIFTLLFCCLAIAAASQSVTVTDSLQFKGGTGRVGKISNDTALAENSDNVLATQKAIRIFLYNHSGGFVNNAGNADSLAHIAPDGFVLITSDGQIIYSTKKIQHSSKITATNTLLEITDKDTINADGITARGLHIDMRNVVNLGHASSGTWALQIDGGTFVLNNNEVLSGYIKGDSILANYDTSHNKKYIGVFQCDSAGNIITSALSPYDNFIVGPLITNDSTHTLIVNGSARIISTPAGVAGNDSFLVKNAAGEVRSIAPVLPARTMDILAWAYSGAYAITTATRNGDEAITTASVQWPDGSTGTYTADVLSTSFPGATDGYHITYVPASGPTRTITQPTLTRDAGGAVTAQPALTITP